MSDARIRDLDAATLAPRDSPATSSEAQTIPPDAATSKGAAAIPPPSIPGYDILGELGRGGMGVVYKARQQGLKRLVALKMILTGAHAGPAELARFRGEAEAVAKLQHPNIVQVYEVGETDGIPFFSLEFVDGGCLADQLQGMPQVPRLAAQLVQVLANAIHCAHQHGIVHRDMKPANILLQKEEASGKETMVRSSIWSTTLHALSSSNQRAGSPGVPLPYGNPKITDFGLAKPVEGDSGLTKSGAIVGTPSYMAPEQADNKQVGPLADVYALGAILYEMLTGRPPFRASTPLDTVLLLITEDPVPPSRLQPKLPRDLETICLKCLEKDQRKRYESAQALAEDLGRYLANEPILARPIGLVGRAVKWARRRPAAAALVGVVALAILVVGAVMVFFNVSLQQERDYAFKLKEIAEEERETATRAKEEAERQRRLAHANFDKAREAVDQLLTRVGDQKFKNVPLLEELQRELLEEALKFNQQFLEEKSGDPIVRQGTAKAFSRAAHIRSLLGQHIEATAAYQQAIDLLKSLAVQFPQEASYRRDLAMNYDALSGAWSILNKFSDSKTACEQSLLLLEQLHGEHPQDQTYRSNLGRGYVRQAQVINDMRLPGFEATLVKAVTLQEALTSEFPDRPEHRSDLGQSLNRLGQHLANTTDSQRMRQAGKTFRLAIGHQESLTKDHPKNPEYREQLADSCHHLGNALAALNDLAGAEEQCRRMLAIIENLVADFPKVPLYREKLSQAHMDLAMIYHGHKRIADAETACRTSTKQSEALMIEFPKVNGYRQSFYLGLSNLASIQAQQGKMSEAEQTLRQAIEAGEVLVVNQPGSRWHHNQIGHMLDQLASWQAERNDLTEASARLKQAIGHQQIALKILPDDPRYLHALSRHRLKLIDILLKEKEYVAAAEMSAELVRADPKQWPGYYNAARVLVRCVRFAKQDASLPEAERRKLARGYGDQALTWLQEARERGFNKSEDLRKNAEFSVLRDRPEFQKLLTELEEMSKEKKN
jgi:tetratricopeptide (TPR) repeat protein